jgi:hypothetical protein
MEPLDSLCSTNVFRERVFNQFLYRISQFPEKMAVFWVVAPCSLVEVYRRFRVSSFWLLAVITRAIALMMEANFYQTTRRNNPEDNHLHTRRRENLKFHFLVSNLCNMSHSYHPSWFNKTNNIR